jgi:hypothetical protein
MLHILLCSQYLCLRETHVIRHGRAKLSVRTPPFARYCNRMTTGTSRRRAQDGVSYLAAYLRLKPVGLILDEHEPNPFVEVEKRSSGRGALRFVVKDKQANHDASAFVHCTSISTDNFRSP